MYLASWKIAENQWEQSYVVGVAQLLGMHVSAVEPPLFNNKGVFLWCLIRSATESNG